MLNNNVDKVINSRYTWLWKSADFFRGMLTDEDFRDYFFQLLFYKLLSDKYRKEYDLALQEFGDEKVAKDKISHWINIPDGCLWDDIQLTRDGVGRRINFAVNEIARMNPRLYNLINKIDFTNQKYLSEDYLSQVFQLISQIDLITDEYTPEIFGQNFELFIKKYMVEAPAGVAEFYTPREVVQILVSCLQPEEGLEIYDPSCGTGGMLIESCYYVKRKLGDPKMLYLFGQEINEDISAIAKINLFLHDVNAEIILGDTLVNPKFLDNPVYYSGNHSPRSASA